MKKKTIMGILSVFLVIILIIGYLVIVVIGMIAMGLGTFTYYKSKNNEI